LAFAKGDESDLGGYEDGAEQDKSEYNEKVAS
jgi:hypothetical protein